MTLGGLVFMTMMFVILQHILCAAQDPAQHRHNDGQRTRMCSSTSNKASCNWTEHLAEQTLPTFSFNQCVGLNYDFMGFFTQNHYVHYSSPRLPNPVLFSRNRVCALHNVCMSGSGEIGSRMRVSFYTPPDLRPFLPNSSFPIFKSGEMVAGGFSVHVEFEPAPSDPAVWYDGATFFQIPGHVDDNFGHVVLNELLSAYTAMDVLGVGNYSHGRFLSNYDIKPPSSKWILPMFARAPILVRDLNVGHCFETLVVGHVLAYGDASFLALRGAVAQRFREYYARAIMCGQNGRQHDAHKINLYQKVGGTNGPVWDHLCSAHMMESIRVAIPNVQLECFDLGSMSMQQQVQVVEQASVHVSPHGGLSYLSLFAQEGASLVLLTCFTSMHACLLSPKDTHILPYMPWLTVSYLSRAHEEMFLAWLVQALRAASFRMHLPQPRFTADMLIALGDDAG